jgi:hypothetical protein
LLYPGHTPQSINHHACACCGIFAAALTQILMHARCGHSSWATVSCAQYALLAGVEVERLQRDAVHLRQHIISDADREFQHHMAQMLSRSWLAQQLRQQSARLLVV